jgi:hypothetical protein
VRIVPPVATATLDARAYFARSWTGGWSIATESKDVLVLDVNLDVLARIDVGTKPEDIAMTSTGTVLVVASSQTLSAVETRGGRPTWTARGNFIGCRTLDSRSIWAAEGRDDEIELSLRDVATGEVIRTSRVADPFRGSAAMFFAHPDDRSTVVWVAAGQDGQTAYLVSNTEARIEATELAPRDRLPPIFLADSGSYLSAGDELLEQYRWPDGQRLGAARWPNANESDDQDLDAAGSDVQIIPGGYATWSSSNGRIYIVDLAEMRIVDELTIAGHPVRTVEQLYPTLRGDQTPCTDFEYAEAGPDGLMLTVHARSRLAITRLRDWSPDSTRYATNET